MLAHLPQGHKLGGTGVARRIPWFVSVFESRLKELAYLKRVSPVLLVVIKSAKVGERSVKDESHGDVSALALC